MKKVKKEKSFFKKNEKEVKKIALLTIVILLIYMGITNFSAVLKVLSGIIYVIRPFILAGILAYLLYIPTEFFEKKIAKRISKKREITDDEKTKIKRRSIAIVYTLFILFLIVMAYLLIPAVYNNVTELIKTLPEHIQSLETEIAKVHDKGYINDEIFGTIDKKISEIKNINYGKLIIEYFNKERVLNYSSKLIEIVKNMVVTILVFIISIYMLFEKDEIKEYSTNFLKARTKKKTNDYILKIVNHGNEIFRKYITAQFVDAMVVAAIMSIALTIMNVRYGLLLGFLIGLFNLIPYFGALTAGIVSILIILISGGLNQALMSGVVILLLQQIDANIIQPKIMSESLDISRILIIFSTTVGGAYFGFWGMFFGVPVVSTIKYIIDDRTNLKNNRKKIQRLINKKTQVKIKKPTVEGIRKRLKKGKINERN